MSEESPNDKIVRLAKDFTDHQIEITDLKTRIDLKKGELDSKSKTMRENDANVAKMKSTSFKLSRENAELTETYRTLKEEINKEKSYKNSIYFDLVSIESNAKEAKEKVRLIKEVFYKELQDTSKIRFQQREAFCNEMKFLNFLPTDDDA
jgi:hypothetical protein